MSTTYKKQLRAVFGDTAASFLDSGFQSFSTAITAFEALRSMPSAHTQRRSTSRSGDLKMAELVYRDLKNRVEEIGDDKNRTRLDNFNKLYAPELREIGLRDPSTSSSTNRHQQGSGTRRQRAPGRK